MLKFIYRNIWIQDIINLIGLELLYLHADHNKKITSCTRHFIFMRKWHRFLYIFIFVYRSFLIDMYRYFVALVLVQFAQINMICRNIAKDKNSGYDKFSWSGASLSACESQMLLTDTCVLYTREPDLLETILIEKWLNQSWSIEEQFLYLIRTYR